MGRPDAETYLEAHEDTCEFVTTSINVKEIAVGRKLQGRFDRNEMLSEFGWLRIVPFTVEHGFQAGLLEASLRSDHELNQDKVNSLLGDLFIASVANDLDAAVVTKNSDDFELLDGVSVETY